jgi:hypothetical protein
MNPQVLKASIRVRMLSMGLPTAKGHQLFRDKSSGTLCTCCRHPITWEQVPYDVVFPTAYDNPVSFAMHMACYDAWRGEWARPMAASA